MQNDADRITTASAGATTRLSYMDAIVEAQMEELTRDPRVIMMGEDLAVYGDGKIVENFDGMRIWSTPISETAFTGVGVGAAMTGLRPIIALSISSFMYLAADPIINQAAKLRYMTGGQATVPIVFRCSMYYGRSIAAQHSDRPYPMFMNVPGLKILCPSTPADMKGLLKSAIRDDDPVLIFEDAKLWPMKGDVPSDPDWLVPIGKADIKREGDDITIVAISGAVRQALDAAERLADIGISAEVIDPRTLKPLDLDTIVRSVRRTGRLLLAELAHRCVNVSSEIAATVAEDLFGQMRAPIRRLGVPDVHIPFSPALESALYPTAATIAAAAQALCRHPADAAPRT
nr:transketolase C-terminal domain-containing protein [Sphingomonas sp. Y57]